MDSYGRFSRLGKCWWWGLSVSFVGSVSESSLQIIFNKNGHLTKDTETRWFGITTHED